MTTLTTGRSADLRHAAGFTLLELLLVMTIIAVVLAGVAPSLSGFVNARTVQDVATEVAVLAGYAWTHSVAEGREYRLYVDPDRRSVTLMADDQGAFTHLEKEMGRDLILPEGISVVWIETPRIPQEAWNPGLRLAEYPEEDTQQQYIRFFPVGRTEPAEIRFTDRRGNTATVVSDSPGERFRVITGERES